MQKEYLPCVPLLRTVSDHRHRGNAFLYSAYTTHSRFRFRAYQYVKEHKQFSPIIETRFLRLLCFTKHLAQ